MSLKWIKLQLASALVLAACSTNHHLHEGTAEHDSLESGRHESSPWVLAGEFEPVDEVILGWAPEFEEFYRDVITALAGHARISVVVAPQMDIAGLEGIIGDVTQMGMLTGKNSEISIVDLDIESVWLRDFGPLVTSRANQKRVVNLDYWAGGADDALAARMAVDWLGLGSEEPGLQLEGGNLQADGSGHCLVSSSIIAGNLQSSEARIREALRENFGCLQTEILPPLPGEPTQHVDMFLTFTGPGELIVGKFDMDDDEELRQHLEWIAAYLQERGFLVRRIPMPRQWDNLYQSYTNSLAVNDVVLVPYFDGISDTLAQALPVFQAAYPGREIIPIESSMLMALNGAIHCATITTPR